MSDENKMEFKVQRWYDNKNRALSNKWYAIGRMDILVISICGGGIYVLFELIKYYKTTQTVDLSGLKIAGILFLIAVAINFISQFLGYYSNSNEALYSNLKFLEAIGDRKVTEDELSVIDKRIKMTKPIVLLLLFILIGGTAYTQANKRSVNGTRKMKTVRLHIDGFMKSKSGAV